MTIRFDIALGAQQRQTTSLFGSSPGPTQRKEPENIPTGMSIDRQLIAANLIVGQTTSPAQSTSTINAVVGVTPHPTGSNPASWSPYSPFNPKPEQSVTAAKKMESWSQSSTTQSEDEESEGSRIRTPPAGFAQPSPLNGTAMFTTTTPPKALPSESESEEDSIEAAVQQHNMQKATGGIQQLVNKQIGNSYLFSQSTTSSSSNVGLNSANKQIGGNYEFPPATSSSNAVQSLVNKQIGSTTGSSPATSSSSGAPNQTNRQFGSTFGSPPATSSGNGIQNLVNKQIGGSYGSPPATSSSNVVQSLVNKQIGGSYGSQPATSFPNAQSPTSEHSSWSSSSIGVNKDSTTTKGISSLVQQQPLLTGKKSNEPTWDDSRPLSADLKRTSILTDSSDESYFDDDGKSATIVKSPYTTPTLSNLVQQNIQPTEPKSTGVENLTKIFDSIMHAKPVPTKL